MWTAVLQALPVLWVAAGDAVAVEDAVEVRGTGMKCPSPGEVAQRIAPLLPAQSGLRSSDWIELSEVPSLRAGAVDVEVRLARTGMEQPLGVRRIERKGTCTEVADAIAVVAASWLGQLAGPAPAVPALPAPILDGSSEDEPSPAAPRTVPAAVVATTPPAPTPTGAKRAPLAVAVASDPVPPAKVGSTLALGGGGGVLTGGDGGLAAIIGFEGALRRQALIARLQVAGTGTRELSFAGGRASWQRVLFSGAVGADLWRAARTSVDFTGAAVLGVMRVRGIDYPVGANATGLDVGVAPAIRVGHAFSGGSAVGWASVGTVLWLRNHVLTVDGDVMTTTRELPAVELVLSLGVTFSLGS